MFYCRMRPFTPLTVLLASVLVTTVASQALFVNKNAARKGKYILFTLWNNPGLIIKIKTHDLLN